MTTTQETSTRERPDSILVFEDADGSIQHCFCTHADGTERLNNAVAAGSAGSLLTSDGIDAELVYAVSPNCRDRVDERKRQLR